MDAETRVRFGFGAPADHGVMAGYTSDGTALGMPSWASRGDFQVFQTVRDDDDDEEDMDAQASALRQVAGLGLASAHHQTTQGPLKPVTWTELEVSCRKLDAAQIRISSVDLTVMEEEEDYMHQAPHFQSPTEEEDNGPHQSHHFQRYPPTIAVARDAQTVEVSYSFNLSLASQESKRGVSNAVEAPRGEYQKPGPLTLHQCTSGTSSPAPSENPKCFIRVPSTGSSSFSSSPASSAPSQRISNVSVCDMIGTGTTPTLMALRGGPERTSSGPWGSPGSSPSPSANANSSANASPAKTAGPLPGTRLRQQGPSSFPGQPQARVVEPRLAQDLHQAAQKQMEEEKEKDVPYKQYSSLVLPGAVSRDQRANASGVRKYIRVVKNRCGELFSSAASRKSKAQI